MPEIKHGTCYTLYCTKTFKSLEGRDLLSRTPTEISVLQARGDHAHLMFGCMAFNICLDQACQTEGPPRAIWVTSVLS